MDQIASAGGNGGATPVAAGDHGVDFSDGPAGGGGGAAGRIRLNTMNDADLTITSGAVITPTATSGQCQGACSTGGVQMP